MLYEVITNLSGVGNVDNVLALKELVSGDVNKAGSFAQAFFDKRSKFVHYRPRTLVVNNLEFDHADIFPDLA